MGRPEQIEPRAPEGSEHGATAELQRIAEEGAVPRPTEPAPAEPATQEVPANVPPPVEGVEVPEEELIVPEPDDEDDDLGPLSEDEELIFGPNTLPEPLTAGAPFGEGPDVVRMAGESDRAFMSRVATTLARSGDKVSRRFADRIAREELGMRRLET